MTDEADSAHALFELLKRTSPECLDLLTSRTTDEFERAFDAYLEKAVIHLEANKKNFAELGEVGLTAVIVASLSKPGLSVTQETHSNGHVDITVEALYRTPARRKLGEAKIYDGYEYHINGLEQLLNRYSTGRDSRGLLLVYFRKKDIKTLFGKVRQQMDVELPLEQVGVTGDAILKWAFLSSHQHSSGETLEVSHVACNLFCDG